MVFALLPAIMKAASSGAGMAARGASGAVGGAYGAAAEGMSSSVAKKALDATIHGPKKAMKYAKDGATSAKKLTGVSFQMSAMMKQSQIFTGTIGAFFQLIGAMVDIMLIPLVPTFAVMLETAGRILGIQSKYMTQDPKKIGMDMLKSIPVLGAVITAIELIESGIGYLIGEGGAVPKIVNNVKKLGDTVQRLWLELKIWGLGLLNDILTPINGLIAMLLKVKIPNPFGGDFYPFGEGATSPLANFQSDVQSAQNAAAEELRVLNNKLDKVVDDDGIKTKIVSIPTAAERSATFARSLTGGGGADIYTGYNIGEALTREEDRALESDNYNLYS